MRLYAFLSLLGILLIHSLPSFCQEIDTKQLNDLFNSLEERNEAMGSISISKNSEILFNRAFGYRYLSKDTKVPANTKTVYRIWSITKVYTATMIMQLTEEGKLSMKTTLDVFFPQLPNANQITIGQMLRHKSGIHDFTQNAAEEDWDANIQEPLTPEFMVNLIASYDADFMPNEKMQYSNSNYLLLGYIIEKVDGNLYEISLTERILSRIGLTETYFSANTLDTLENKAFSYRYVNQWEEVDEGSFSGPVPGGAGGIVATTNDMAKFVEALFSGKLVSKNSLTAMMDDQGTYGLGMMKIYLGGKVGYGHTGGNKASESSLFYFPEDSLAIAYCANGREIGRDKILTYVLAILDGLPFAVSFNRKVLGLIIFVLAFIFVILMRWRSKVVFNLKNVLLAGFSVFIFFWAGVIISGLLLNNYSHVKDDISLLTSFYSNSGTFISTVYFIVVIMAILFMVGLFKFCKRNKISIVPVLPIFFMIISLLGSTLFPSPDMLNPVFANIIIFTITGPILTIILWRHQNSTVLRWASITSLILMSVSLSLIFARSSYPVFVGDHFGLLQRILYLGITIWIASLSYFSLQRLNVELPQF